MKNKQNFDLQEFLEAKQTMQRIQDSFINLVQQTIDKNPIFKCHYVEYNSKPLDYTIYSNLNIGGIELCLYFQVLYDTFKDSFCLKFLEISCDVLNISRHSISVNVNRLKLYCTDKDYFMPFHAVGRKLTVINETQRN